MKLKSTTDDRILWVDCIGGLVVGCVVIALCRQISELENLPLWVVAAMGVGNVLYGGYSMYVTTRNPRPRMLVQMLAIANMLWLLVCIAVVAAYWQCIATIGVLHLLGEGFFVAALGYAEWKWRDKLSTQGGTGSASDRGESS